MEKKGFTFWWCNQILEFLSSLADKVGVKRYSNLAGARRHPYWRYILNFSYIYSLCIQTAKSQFLQSSITKSCLIIEESLFLFFYLCQDSTPNTMLYFLIKVDAIPSKLLRVCSTVHRQESNATFNFGFHCFKGHLTHLFLDLYINFSPLIIILAALTRLEQDTGHCYINVLLVISNLFYVIHQRVNCVFHSNVLQAIASLNHNMTSFSSTGAFFFYFQHCFFNSSPSLQKTSAALSHFTILMFLIMLSPIILMLDFFILWLLFTT